MLTDVLFVAWNRLEFTKESLRTLFRNTDWTLVNSMTVHDDGSTDGTREFCIEMAAKFNVTFSGERQEGPVGVFNHFLKSARAPLVAKIDNDTMVPPGWLNECATVMERSPELHLLGIEPHSPEDAIGMHAGGPPVVPAGGTDTRSYIPARHIGGIGVMRTAVFENNLPSHGGRYGGFTHWQYQNVDRVKAGWISPPLPVFLLNRMPLEPWCSLSDEYGRREWQRYAGRYWSEEASHLWSWWDLAPKGVA